MPVPSSSCALLWSGGLFESGANWGPQLLGIARALEPRRRDRRRRRSRHGCIAASVSRPSPRVTTTSSASLLVLRLSEGHGARRASARAAPARVARHQRLSRETRPDISPERDRPFPRVGDGKRSMVRLPRVTSGKRPLMRIVGPESVEDPTTLVPCRWELLQRSGIARRSRRRPRSISRGVVHATARMEQRSETSRARSNPGGGRECRLDSFLDSRRGPSVADALSA
jgi:hypothetical protein